MTTENIYALYTQSYKVVIDTRKIEKNCLFFGFKGEKVNGNAFAEQAIHLGALAAFVEEVEFANPSMNIFYVESSLISLQELAKYHRSKLNIPVLGLTGSNGKTTTKELMAAVIHQKYNCVFTQGNLNNHLGVPLTLLEIRPETEFAIIEMGANHIHEIDLLCNIAQPNLGYITNFGKAHLEGFGGIEGVIKGKSELYAYLFFNKAMVLVNQADAIQEEKTANYNRKITFGTKDSQYYIELLPKVDNQIRVKYKNTEIISQLTGDYNFSNVSAAMALGLFYGITIEKVKEGIEAYTPENKRSQIILKNEKTLVLDAYNANPSSMEAALQNFSTYKGSKTIILGDMFELGEFSVEEHKKLIENTSQLGFERRIFIGEEFYKLKNTTDEFYPTKAEFIEILSTQPINSKNILIKASRGIALETLIDYL